MNRRQSWYQRPVRRKARQAPNRGTTLVSPLSLFFVVNLVGSLISLLFGFISIALVFAIAALGCVACQSRNHSGLPS
jgi:hypothetical protein